MNLFPPLCPAISILRALWVEAVKTGDSTCQRGRWIVTILAVFVLSVELRAQTANPETGEAEKVAVEELAAGSGATPGDVAAESTESTDGADGGVVNQLAETADGEVEAAGGIAADATREADETAEGVAAGGDDSWAPDDVVLAEDPPFAADEGGAGAVDGLLLERRVGNCTIFGEVSDGSTLDPIAGAIVTIQGAGREVETNAQGGFRVDGLPSGDFTVEVLKLGYSMGEASASPRPDSPAEVRIALKVKPSGAGDGEYVMEEETVVGEYNETNQGDFVLDLASSVSLSSGLSAEDFAKENVSDAGQALAKISGANVVGGKFAVVRGLSDRYIGTTFNGAQISSAVADRKAIELDLFPTSAIQAIDVAKTYRPDLLGDFGGAAIDIQSRNFPNERIAFAKVKTKYNPSLPDEILTVPGGGLGFFGETSRELDTSDFTSTNSSGQVRLITQPAADAAETWRRLESSASSFPEVTDSNDEYSYGVGYGDTIGVTDYLEMGFLVAHGWKNGSSYNESSELRAPDRSWYQRDYTQFTEWDVYAALSARVAEDHEVNFVYFRKHIAENNVTWGSELREPSNDYAYGSDSIVDLQGTRAYYGADAEQMGGFYELQPLERDLEILQLSGKNKLGDRGVRMRWSLTDSDASEVQPYTTFQEYTTLDFDSPALAVAQQVGESVIIDTAESALGLPSGSLTFDEARQAFLDNGASALLARLEEENLPVIDSSLGQINTLALTRFSGAVGRGNTLSRATQSVKESTTDSQIAFDIPYYFSEENEDSGFELGLGASRIERTRQNRGSLYELVYEDFSAAGDSQGGFDESEFYPSPDGSGANLGGSLFESGASVYDYITGNKNGPYYEDGSIGTDNFTGLVANNANGYHNFQSVFLSGNLFFGDTFIRGGVRYESEDREAYFLEPKPTGEEDADPISEDIWLPSVTMGTSVFDGKLNLIAAWSKTVARPTFFEWMPVRTFDLSTGFIRSGNPDLLNSSITNFDLAAEFKPVENSTLRVSVFNKEILDPIVSVRVPGVADSITFINGDKGLLSGVEMEAEITELGPFSLKGNLTYIDATLEYSFNTGETVSVNFPYQPNWIGNLNLGYDYEPWDFGVNLIYNYTGEYATLLKTTSGYPDVIREPVHSLDLVLRKGFELESGGKVGVSVGVTNLVGSDQIYRFSGGSDEIDGEVRSETQTDRVFFAELKYDF